MNLSGLWQSKYRYSSDVRKQEFENEHEVIFEHSAKSLIGKSKDSQDGSQLVFDLKVDDNIVTGTWSEKTSTSGYYKGMVFHGAIQLVILENGRKMIGQWVGYNSGRTKIKTGEWQLVKKV